MTRLRLRTTLPCSILLLLFVMGCGSGTSPTRQVPVSPTTPTGPGGGGSSGPVTLSAPTAISPVNDELLSTLRPTLTVQNATSSASGSRTYEFQVSDRTDFSIGASLTESFLVSVNQTGVAEGSDGRTSFTVSSDLQPTTRMYWRARVAQGSSTSSWSDAARFRTKVAGYSRAGELYDPLINGETIGTLVGSHTWVPGKGLRLDSERSYVEYQLAQVLTSGEMSVEVEGLRPNGPNHKLKIFSMNDTPGDITHSNFGMSTMYRGVNGNPANAISYKAVFGSQSRIAEPDRAIRNASIVNLDPSRTYFWRATWGSDFRLLVADGGVNGNVIYDRGEGAPGGATYRPGYAWLGSNQGAAGLDAATFPGSLHRHLYIGNRPRPPTLGSALD